MDVDNVSYVTCTQNAALDAISDDERELLPPKQPLRGQHVKVMTLGGN